MSSVEFLEQEGSKASPSFRSRKILGQPVQPPIIRWIMRLGIVKSERTAGRLLLIITIGFFIAAIGIYFFFHASGTPQPKTVEEFQKMFNYHRPGT